MVVSEGDPMKKMKARVTADFYDFLTFPSLSAEEGEEDDDVDYIGGPFCRSVRAFLSRHALLPPPSALFPHLLTWRMMLRVGEETAEAPPPVVCLDVVEEDVERSRSVYCDQCRVVGEFTRFLVNDSLSLLWFHRFYFFFIRRKLFITLLGCIFRYFIGNK